MKKYILLLLLFSLLAIVTGCSTKKMNTQKIRDVDFSVVEEKHVPKELKEMIKQKEEAPFKLTYADNGILYIAEGYGEKPTSGYSAQVDECYETANAIYIHTNLLGPSKEEEVVETKVCPYVVIKMEFIEKNVVFK